MKVKELIQKLAGVDPDLEVCIFDNSCISGPRPASGLGVYFGTHQYDTIQLITAAYDTGAYVGIGFPGGCSYRIPPTLIHDLDRSPIHGED